MYTTAAGASSGSGQHSVDLGYLVAFSTLLLVFSLALAFRAAFAENQVTNLNLREMEEKQREELRKKFKKMLGDNREGGTGIAL